MASHPTSWFPCCNTTRKAKELVDRLRSKEMYEYDEDFEKDEDEPSSKFMVLNLFPL